jgi:hypothetical protein
LWAVSGSGARRSSAPKTAGHSLDFLVADDEDWPKELYRRLGFEPRAHCWEFIREPAEDQPM